MPHVTNTNLWSTKQLVIMALFSAVAILISFIEIVLIPSASYLSYDPAFMPAMVCGFAYGAGPGAVVSSIAAIGHGMITGNWVGALMNVFAGLFFVVPAALIYHTKRTYPRAIIGLAVGVVFAIVGGVLTNLTLGVWFWYGSIDQIAPLILPVIVPFNLLKGLLNAVLTLLVYKAISNLITPVKDQKKGK